MHGRSKSRRVSDIRSHKAKAVNTSALVGARFRKSGASDVRSMGAKGNRGLQEMGDAPDLVEMERRMAQAHRDVILWEKKALLTHLRNFARLLELVPDETGQVAKIRAQMLMVHADAADGGTRSVSSARM